MFFLHPKLLETSCFSEITKEGAINLFRFPELVAKGKKLQERIFPLMELHEALFMLWPEIELTFNAAFHIGNRQHGL